MFFLARSASFTLDTGQAAGNGGLIISFSFFYDSSAVETYRSPVETLCTNIDYFIPDDKGATKTFSEDAMARLRKSSSAALDCLGRERF